MIDTLLRVLFRCSHRSLTRPITPLGQRRVPQGETYVVCLECGTHLPYDWSKMRLGRPVVERRKAVPEKLAVEHSGIETSTAAPATRP